MAASAPKPKFPARRTALAAVVNPVGSAASAVTDDLTGKPTGDPTDDPIDDLDRAAAADPDAEIHPPRLWRADRWTARVIKNEDDEGWAVAMIQDGEIEPALVGPWTMGRDKKNPKPLDSAAFNTLVKTAAEVLRRHEQQRHAELHKSVTVHTAELTRWTVTLDIVPDEDNPSASLRAVDAAGEAHAQVSVSPGFQLNANSALAWIDADFKRPKR